MLMGQYPIVTTLFGNELFLITDPNTSDPANNVSTNNLALYIATFLDVVDAINNSGNLGEGVAIGITETTIELNNIAPNSTKISVSLDNTNHNILLDVVPANIDINSLGGTPLTPMNGGTGTSLSTGTGALVLQTSPTLITPILGVSSATSEVINGTSGAGFIELQVQSVLPASGAGNSNRLFTNSSANFSWKHQADGFNRSFAGTLTADRAYTLQDSSDTFVMRATTDTLTNKSISGASNTLTNIPLTTAVTGTLPIANGGTNSASYTNGSVIFFNGTALTQNNAQFFWDNTNIALGIGVTPAVTTVLDIVNNSGLTKAIQVTGYGGNVGVRGRYANGTLSSPTAATTGNILEFISGRGYGATAFPAASTAVMNIIAAATFTDSSMPTYINFLTTPTASITSVEAMRINTTSNILIGTTTDNATDKLQINGSSSGFSFTANGTAGAGFVELDTQSANPSVGSISSVRLFSSSTGNFSWKKQSDGFVRSLTSTLTADRVYTLQDSSDTFVMRATTDTLTNKTISGASNTITNVSLTTGVTGTLPVVNGGTGVTSSTGTTSVVLSNSPTLVTPTIGVASSTSISNGDGTVSLPSYTFSSDNNNGFYISGTDKVGVSSNGNQVAEFNPTGFLVQNNIILKLTNTTIVTASTATGAELLGGIISCTSGGAFTLTFDTAANIYAAMGSPNFVGASFVCNILANGGANVTIATNTGLTLILAATNITNDMRQYVFVVTNTSTPTFTVYGG